MKKTYLSEVLSRDRGEARRLVEKVLFEELGSPAAGARRLGVSRPFFNWVLRRLGMTREPARIRALSRGFFRLPPRGIVR